MKGSFRPGGYVETGRTESGLSIAGSQEQPGGLLIPKHVADERRAKEALRAEIVRAIEARQAEIAKTRAEEARLARLHRHKRRRKQRVARATRRKQR